MTTDGFTVTWRYAGLRPGSKGPVTVWYDDDGGRRVYGAPKSRSHLAVGGRYEIPSCPDFSTLSTSQARFVEMVDDADRSSWVAEDRATQAELAGGAAVKAAKRSETGTIENMTLGEARRFVNGGTYANQAARLAIVLKTLGVA